MNHTFLSLVNIFTYAICISISFFFLAEYSSRQVGQKNFYSIGVFAFVTMWLFLIGCLFEVLCGRL